KEVIGRPGYLGTSAEPGSVAAAEDTALVDAGASTRVLWPRPGCLRDLPEIFEGISRLSGLAEHLSKAASFGTKAEEERGSGTVRTGNQTFDAVTRASQIVGPNDHNGVQT